MIEFQISSSRRNEMIDITDKIKKIVSAEKIENGIAVIYIPHTTAGVTINEGADPSVQRDIISTLNKIIPENGDYHHMEGNSDAHIKASLIGSSTIVIIEKGRLILGTWQHIFFYEGNNRICVYFRMIHYIHGVCTSHNLRHLSSSLNKNA